MSHPFEINVALIGYVSVGKTTFLNALLKDKYSEVSMRRTTSGVNKFRISTRSSNEKSTCHRSSGSTLEEISKDNKAFRDVDKLHVKTFDIEIDEPFFEMRDDTKLVLIDVPGINEAGASEKYSDYISKHWHTFDSVVVILDGRQGVNTEEQVNLLKFAKKHCDTVKKVSVMTIMNKIDDPDDQEQQLLVKEAQAELERIFQKTGTENTLAAIVSKEKNLPYETVASSPVLLPMSTIHAYIYRAASQLDFATFKEKIDDDLIEKLGREGYGRKWKRFTSDLKAQKAFEIIQDEEEVEDGLKASKFDQCMAVLSFFVGGKGTQKWLIQQQIESTKKRLTIDHRYGEELRGLYEKVIAFGKSSDFIVDVFRELHKKHVGRAQEQFVLHPKNVHMLAMPMKEIFSFFALLGVMKSPVSLKQEAISMAKVLVKKQVDYLLKPNVALSDYDTMNMYGSILGAVPGSFFDEHFGMTRIVLEKLYHKTRSNETYRPSRKAHYLRNEMDLLVKDLQWNEDGKLVHTKPQQISLKEVSDSPLNDPHHFGHLLCQYEKLVLRAGSLSTGKRKSMNSSDGHEPKRMTMDMTSSPTKSGSADDPIVMNEDTVVAATPSP